ncbi:hypothetical protein SDC9_150782 [bioreactor metagenome]|uniref:Uncharacterized protein n=1 Tax=bioreactor metagenome TaxID=1076179 RepID=A0A645EQL0_9ZZZZ
MLQYDKNELAGKLNILNTQCSIFNVSAAGENIEFRCDIDTVIGDITCEVHLTDKSGKLYGMVQTNKGCMAITGQKLFS